MSIPKILHQIWIGPKSPPTILMKTWEDKHPDFEYILWTEDELLRREMELTCIYQIDTINEINGKADIIRWEILKKYGGVFVDADTICIEPIDEYFMCKSGFACFENENIRGALVATTYMGFTPNHPVCTDIVKWISESDEAQYNIKNLRAWGSVGPALLTRFLDTGKYRSCFSVFPSHCLLPVHFTGDIYMGHEKVYAYHEWGTAKGNYANMNNITIPYEFTESVADYRVSILIYGKNVPKFHVRECLNSIMCQSGSFGIEVIWTDGGSDDEHLMFLEFELDRFNSRTRFCSSILDTIYTDRSKSACLNSGVNLCTCEFIMRADASDVMVIPRISKQLGTMIGFTGRNISGCGVNSNEFKNINKTDMTIKNIINTNIYPEMVDWNAELSSTLHPCNIMYSASACFRRDAVLDVGNYTTSDTVIDPDYELILRLMAVYGTWYNIQESLCLHRT